MIFDTGPDLCMTVKIKSYRAEIFFFLMSGLTMGETNLRVMQDSVPYSTP